jgi:hypothetical protein
VKVIIWACQAGSRDLRPSNRLCPTFLILLWLIRLSESSCRAFMAEYHMECPRAVERFQRGVPATVTNPIQDDRGEAVKVNRDHTHISPKPKSVSCIEMRSIECQPGTHLNRKHTD